MTVICMSQAELNRLTVVMDFAEGRLTAPQAAQMLRLTERQAWRLLRRFRQDGAPGLVSPPRLFEFLLELCRVRTVEVSIKHQHLRLVAGWLGAKAALLGHCSSLPWRLVLKPGGL